MAIFTSRIFAAIIIHNVIPKKKILYNVLNDFPGLLTFQPIGALDVSVGGWFFTINGKHPFSLPNHELNKVMTDVFLIEYPFSFGNVILRKYNESLC